MFRMPHGPPMQLIQLTKERLRRLAGLKDKSAPCTLQINMCSIKTILVTATTHAVHRPGATRELNATSWKRKESGAIP